MSSPFRSWQRRHGRRTPYADPAAEQLSRFSSFPDALEEEDARPDPYQLCLSLLREPLPRLRGGTQRR